MGINAAKSRNWEGAIFSFKAATEESASPTELAKAFYNLGTALLYSGNFLEARTSLQKSAGMGLQEANEQLATLTQRESEEKRLQQQLQ